MKKHSLSLNGRKVDLINRLNERKAFLHGNGIQKEVQIVLRRIESTTKTAVQYEKRKLRSNKKTPLAREQTTHGSAIKAKDGQSQAPLSPPNPAQSSQSISNMEASSSINAALENHRVLRSRIKAQVPHIVAVEDVTNTTQPPLQRDVSRLKIRRNNNISKNDAMKLDSNKIAPLMTKHTIHVSAIKQSQAPLLPLNSAQNSPSLSNTNASGSIKADLENHQHLLRSRTAAQSLQSQTPHILAEENAKKRSKPPLQTNDSRLKIRRIDNIPKNEVMITASPARRQRRGNKSRKMVANILTLQPSYRNFELVWAHLRGYPLWPAIIEDECLNGKYTIHFFGDHTRATVTKSKIFHSFEGFSRYTKLNSTNTLLHKAVREMHLFIFEKDKLQSCCICDLLKMKRLQSSNKKIN